VAALTFRHLADLWTSRYGHQLASARNDAYRLKQITAFTLPGYSQPVTMGDKPAGRVTVLEIEAYRDHRKAAGLSAVSINQDLRLLRKIFNWGIRKDCIERTPFKEERNPRFSSNEKFRATGDSTLPMMKAVSSPLPPRTSTGSSWRCWRQRAVSAKSSISSGRTCRWIAGN
jgi:hypothetical protein